MEQMEHALLYTFLEASSDCKFKEQLWSLKSPAPFSNQGFSSRSTVRLQGPGFDDEFELQCDGNRSGHLQNGELEADTPVNEDVIRIIAAHLAEIGDKLDKDVHAKVVNDLVQHFLNEKLSKEEIMRHMSRVVRELAQAIPSDMEQEKFMLVLVMVLTKKIVNTVPSLLHHVFSTSVNFINQQFHNYIVEMLDTAGRSKAASTGSHQELPHFSSMTIDLWLGGSKSPTQETKRGSALSRKKK